MAWQIRGSAHKSETYLRIWADFFWNFGLNGGDCFRDEKYKIGAEPESFRLENAGPNIYVSIPDLQQMAVINRETKKITRWPLTGLRKNFPWHSTRRITAYSSACANRPCFPCFAPSFVVELLSAGCSAPANVANEMAAPQSKC
jgi:hypothetical protein